MKKILLVALAAITLASCAKNEAIELNDSNAISFRAWTSNAARVAPTTSTGDGTAILKFKTWAFTNADAIYFNGVEVSRPDKDSDWDYSPHKFWPSAETKLDFYSVSPSSTTCAITAASQQIVDYTVNTEVASQIDLLYAVNLEEARQNPVEAVNVQFDLALSQITFAAKCSNSQLQVDIKSVSIVNVNSVGTFTFPTVSTNATDQLPATGAAWSAQGTLATFDTGMVDGAPVEVPLNNTSVALTKATDGRPLLIPQTITGWAPKTDAENTANGAYFIVKCSVQDVSSGVYLWGGDATYTDVAIPFSGTWHPGTQYLYTFVFGEGAGYEVPEAGDGSATPVLFPITFTVDVDTFEDASSSDTNMKPAA